ncbi:UNVERIFIED_CONTAM: hypothetical protein HDU68_011506 [Siphonaria sp. JEL0065]|nr:hypothetical protein HDU68_011506 [Siphonaria sp. JEL0065]
MASSSLIFVLYAYMVMSMPISFSIRDDLGIQAMYNNITKNAPLAPTTTIAVRHSVSAAEGIGGCIIGLTGFVFCFTGKKAYLPSLFFSGFFSIGIIVFTILDVAQSRWHSFGPYADWIYLVLLIPTTILGGFLFRRVSQLGVVMIGALHGYSWALILLFTGIGSGFHQSAHIIFILAAMSIGATSIFFMEHMALIMGTAFSGGFFVSIGADLFACTGFVEALRMGISNPVPVGVGQVPGTAWGIMAAYCILGIAGWYVQTRSSPARQQTDWNPAYHIFGANLPSAAPPVWFQMPANKPVDAVAPTPKPFSVYEVVCAAIGKALKK